MSTHWMMLDEGSMLKRRPVKLLLRPIYYLEFWILSSFANVLSSLKVCILETCLKWKAVLARLAKLQCRQSPWESPSHLSDPLAFESKRPVRGQDDESQWMATSGFCVRGCQCRLWQSLSQSRDSPRDPFCKMWVVNTKAAWELDIASAGTSLQLDASRAQVGKVEPVATVDIL